MSKLRFAWKYRRWLWKYRGLWLGRRKWMAGAMTGAALATAFARRARG